jgi:hypothetical protein
MIQSKFDMLVNRILKESLMGGNFTSAGGAIAKPQETQADDESLDQETDQEKEQLPIPSTQQTAQKTPQQQNVASNSSNDADAIKALITQMKDNANKEEEFQKKLIATQTAAMKSAPTQQTTSATTNPPPIAGNLDTKQVLSNLMGLK